MIGPDARRDVRVERRPAGTRGMTVHMIGEPGLQLGELRVGAGDDAREVHHLGHADRAVAAQQALDVTGRERPARRLEARGGHARRGHHIDVQRQVGAAVEQPVDAVGAEDVRDLVGVGDDGRRAVSEDRPRELVDHELR